MAVINDCSLDLGEDAETIAARKLTAPWGKWLCDDASASDEEEADVPEPAGESSMQSTHRHLPVTYQRMML